MLGTPGETFSKDGLEMKKKRLNPQAHLYTPFFLSSEEKNRKLTPLEAWWGIGVKAVAHNFNKLIRERKYEHTMGMAMTAKTG
jgi:hypothetical protein